MPFTSIGILAVGKLPNTETELYAAASTPTAYMVSVNVRLAAEDAVAYGVHLFVRKSGDSTSYRVTGFSYALASGGEAVYPSEGSLKLGPGDSLRGYAATANKVHYVIEGGLSPVST